MGGRYKELIVWLGAMVNLKGIAISGNENASNRISFDNANEKQLLILQWLSLEQQSFIPGLIPELIPEFVEVSIA